MRNDKTKVAVVFGSRSVEHEVSIMTAMQVFKNIDRDKYEVIPIYIDKTGRWFVDKKLEKLESYKNLKLTDIKAPEYIFNVSPSVKALAPKSAFKFLNKISADIYFTAIHGTFGEDGTLQGLFEMADAAYTGSGVTGSAVGMDKIIQKSVFKEVGLPTVKYVWFLKSEWEDNKIDIIKNIEKELSYPVFVKPANLGSSVAINKASGVKELEGAINIASQFDRRIIIEEGKENIIEINCSVLGNSELIASVCEQPLGSEQMLSYEDKYMKGGKMKGMAGLSRLVPAPISEKLARRIQEMAKTAFRSVDASGVARIDFIVSEQSGDVWINEINTLPGSLSFYLWEKSGLDIDELIDRLINLGFERHKERKKLIFSYDSDLISEASKESEK
ncbi:MAG: D-alanine-D-alanine ligase [Candidatus Azambacteria bacterium GW2011_GWE1_42_9]|nr:MAG: D-alanine-D-alanine ligase [Candidatus Azambacteria bacterium GW2011_GWF1_41_10]KKS49183.1 MAG: D-alanine-D-alanine ligase [Candidatus Azambacteria bacterium GW2011_GWF2_42_22]KKS78823.1 MAG: D-alanine-D-alanine ligase [Candidatus Azambacteria bacterium GW2011_GWE1_42_9]KKT03112.1 MAG: D-alanine-D-alanine ligase [Candidatus Azambacteria bacterium GW2011_GWD1_43_18]KKT12030.1 MAG: D-alanine-D-alanine ligase [Candidatus Azambacteria bacterium GW2011_GWC2_43_27]KKT17125.1 MAG: D-alanine-D